MALLPGDCQTFSVLGSSICFRVRIGDPLLTNLKLHDGEYRGLAEFHVLVDSRQAGASAATGEVCTLCAAATGIRRGIVRSILSRPDQHKLEQASQRCCVEK